MAITIAAVAAEVLWTGASHTHKPAPAPSHKPAPSHTHQPAPQKQNNILNVLRHLQHFTYDILNTSEEFTAEIPLGDKISFELGVDSSRRQYWRVTNYDSGICRVKIRNIRSGLFRHEYKTTVRIKALHRGQCTLVLDSAPKTFIVHITVY